MDKQKLTARQYDVLQVIKDYIKVHSWPPTRKEIAEIMQFKSVNAADQHVRALASKGHITIIPDISRGIRVNN